MTASNTTNNQISFLRSALDIPVDDYQEITQLFKDRRKPVNAKIDSGVFSGILTTGVDYPLPLTAPIAQDSLFQIYKQCDPKLSSVFI